MKSIDFYLSSTESSAFSSVFACEIIKQVCLGKRKDGLMINIEPPIDLKKYNIGESTIDTFLVFGRFQGESVLNPKKWPVNVYIVRIINNEIKDSYEMNEIENLAWGEIYSTKENAGKKVFSEID